MTLFEGTTAISRPKSELTGSVRAASLSSSSQIGPAGNTGRTVRGGGDQPFPAETTTNTDSVSLSGQARSEASANGQPTETTGQQVDPGRIDQSLESIRDRDEARRENLDASLNEQLRLKFSRDEDTGRDVFQLVEADSGEVVRQIPPENILEFIKRFQSSVSGILVSEQA